MQQNQSFILFEKLSILIEMDYYLNDFDPGFGSNNWDDVFEIEQPIIQDTEAFDNLNIESDYIEPEHFVAPPVKQKKRKPTNRTYGLKDLPPEPDVFEMLMNVGKQDEQEHEEVYFYENGRRLNDGKIIPNSDLRRTFQEYALEFAVGFTLITFLLLLLFVTYIRKEEEKIVRIKDKRKKKKKHILYKLVEVQ